jgi:hypothetical protein
LRRRRIGTTLGQIPTNKKVGFRGVVRMKLLDPYLPSFLRVICGTPHFGRLLPSIAFLGLVACGGGGTSSSDGSASSVSSSNSGSSTSSGGSSSSGGAGANQAVAGLWNAASGNAVGALLVTGDGRFFYQSSSFGGVTPDTINTGQLSVAGNTLTGTQDSAEYYGHGQGYGINISGEFTTAPVSGSVTQNATISFAGNTWTYDTRGLYNEPSSQTAVAGMWSSGFSTADGGGNDVAIVNAAGALFESASTALNDCTVNGNVSVIDPAHNAYEIGITYSGTDCVEPILGATGAGLAYLDYTTTPATLRYAIPVQTPSGNTGIISGGGLPYQSLGGVWTAAPQAGETGLMLSDYIGNFFYSLAFNSGGLSGCTAYFQGLLNPVDSSGATTGNGNFASVPSGCFGNAQSEMYTATLSPNASLMLANSGSISGLLSPITWGYQSAPFNQPSSLALISGTWLTPGGAVDSYGNLSGSMDSSNCTVTGRIAIIDPATNVYRLGLVYSGCTSVPADLSAFITDATGLNGASVTGLATIDTSVTPNQLDMWSLFQFADGSPNAIAYVVGTSN